MPNRDRPPLRDLDAFGLDRRALLRLGDRQVRVYVGLRHPYGDEGVVRRWQRRGLQTVEDRILIVRAYDHDDARFRLETEWRQYATPYFNMAGRRVRWQMEEIVGSYEIMEGTIDPRGTEVWSTRRTRRLRPDRVWLPSRRRATRRASSRSTQR
jgi:hypothetical protein